MSCGNIKTNFVRMSDTKFYCCDDFKTSLFDVESFADNWKVVPKYCPFCGSKIR